MHAHIAMNKARVQMKMRRELKARTIQSYVRLWQAKNQAESIREAERMQELERKRIEAEAEAERLRELAKKEADEKTKQEAAKKIAEAELRVKQAREEEERRKQQEERKRLEEEVLKREVEERRMEEQFKEMEKLREEEEKKRPLTTNVRRAMAPGVRTGGFDDFFFQLPPEKEDGMLYSWRKLTLIQNFTSSSRLLECLLLLTNSSNML